MVKVLKPFLHEGAIVHAGDVIKADPERHAALARNGLVEAPKQAPSEPDAAPPEPGVVANKPKTPRRKKLVGN